MKIFVDKTSKLLLTAEDEVADELQTTNAGSIVFLISTDKAMNI
jgi:hypothetical protein